RIKSRGDQNLLKYDSLPEYQTIDVDLRDLRQNEEKFVIRLLQRIVEFPNQPPLGDPEYFQWVFDRLSPAARTMLGPDSPLKSDVNPRFKLLSAIATYILDNADRSPEFTSEALQALDQAVAAYRQNTFGESPTVL